MKKSFSTITRLDNNTIAISEYDYKDSSTHFHIRFSIIGVCIIFAIILIVMYFYINESENIQKTIVDNGIVSAPTDNSISVDNIISIDSSGFVFANSDIEYLTENDLVNLEQFASTSGYTYQYLLRHSINEIYARHGYQFIINGPNDIFYNQYDWYKQLDKVKRVPWEQFSKIEQHNLNLLIKAEEDNGFR